MKPTQTSAAVLLILSLTYLSTPVLMFILGWLKAPLALLGATALLAGTVWLANTNAISRGRSAATAWAWLKTNRGQLLWLVILTVGLALLSGIGGFAAQTADWYKHNAILKELSQANWPAFVQQDGGQYPLVYYLAYYLPAALAGKFLKSWLAINVLLLIWSSLGLLLVFAWLSFFLRRAPVRLAMLFILFSGLDVLGIFASLPWQKAGFLASLLDPSHLDGWASSIQYSSMATQLIWVPQHAIAGWILAAMCFYLYQHGDLRRHFVFVCAVSLLWSPFVLLGLGIFLLADLWAGGVSLKGSRKNLMAYLPGVLLGLLLLSYFASPLSSANRGLRFSFTASDHPSPLLIYPLFLLAEFGLYALLIWKNKEILSQREQKLFLVTCTFLVLLPIVRLGVFNDLVMRASIPALFVLAFFAIQLLLQPGLSRTLRIGLVVLFIFGSLTPLFEYGRQILRSLEAENFSASRPLEKVDGLEELLDEEAEDISGYYIGDPDAWFFSQLAQPPR